jgi:hypothetical protein
MSEALLVLISILAIGLPVILIIFWADWTTHRNMTIEYSDSWGYGTFKQFKMAFDILDWERDKGQPESYFGKGSDSYENKIHASIIKFSGKGMVLYPWSYIKFSLWLKKNSLKKDKKKVNWQF